MSQAEGTPGIPGRSQQFRPVQGGEELQSGGKLLVEAYAVIWLVLFGFIWMSRRVQRRLDARVAQLEAALARAQASAPAAHASATAGSGASGKLAADSPPDRAEARSAPRGPD